MSAGAEFYAWRQADCRLAPMPSRQLRALAPAQLFLCLTSNISAEAGENPALWRAARSDTIELTFEDVTIACEDFFAHYGDFMAAIPPSYALTILGTTPRGETGVLRAADTGEAVQFQSLCGSGAAFDTLSGLCIQITPPSSAQADLWLAAFSAADYRHLALALPKTAEAAAQESGLLCPTFGSLFCYLSYGDAPLDGEMIACLSRAQKGALWAKFLQDGTCPTEFDWLWQAHAQGQLSSTLAWELSLQEALAQGGFSVQHAPAQFKVLRADGTALPLNFLDGCAAEKLFLKLMFPVKAGG